MSFLRTSDLDTRLTRHATAPFRLRPWSGLIVKNQGKRQRYHKYHKLLTACIELRLRWRDISPTMDECERQLSFAYADSDQPTPLATLGSHHIRAVTNLVSKPFHVATPLNASVSVFSLTFPPFSSVEDTTDYSVRSRWPDIPILGNFY